MARKHKSPRGYLLAEAAVAGGILASCLAITFALIASGRSDVTYAAKHAEAVVMARAKADELAVATTCAAVTSGGFIAAPTGGGFKIKFVVSDTTLALNNGAAAIPANTLCQADVQVLYPCAIGSIEDESDLSIGGTRTDRKGLVTVTKLWSRQ